MQLEIQLRVALMSPSLVSFPLLVRRIGYLYYYQMVLIFDNMENSSLSVLLNYYYNPRNIAPYDKEFLKYLIISCYTIILHLCLIT